MLPYLRPLCMMLCGFSGRMHRLPQNGGFCGTVVGMKGYLITLLVLLLALAGISLYSRFYGDGSLFPGLPHATAAAVETAAAVPSASAAPEPTPSATPDDAQFSDTDSLLLCANKKHKLPDGYVPSDLTNVTVNGTVTSYTLRREAAEAMTKMFAGAAQDGVQLVLTSAYRSYEYQYQLYNGYVAQYGSATADTISSRPGYSDHQTGLAADITSSTYSALNQGFAQDSGGIWLAAHAHEYGFIMRYPQGKQDITGYAFEPWHFRYIGVDNASALYAAGDNETFEEYYSVEGGDYAS